MACVRVGCGNRPAAADMFGIQPVQLGELMLPDPLIDLPTHVARTYHVVPVEMDESQGRKLYVAPRQTRTTLQPLMT